MPLSCVGVAEMVEAFARPRFAKWQCVGGLGNGWQAQFKKRWNPKGHEHG